MDASLQVDLMWLAFCAVLVMLMQAGFLFLETGMTRRKNSVNVAAKNIVDLGLAILVFWLFGFGLMHGTSQAGWFGLSHFAIDHHGGGPDIAIFFFFNAMFCGAACTILSGAIAERVHVGTYLLVTFVVAGFLYPIFGHWVRGGMFDGTSDGWLRAAGFVDFAGASTVHSVGGWVALALLLIIGPRAGRFTESGKPVKLPRSSLSQSTLGTVLLFISWIGFNGGSVLVFDESVPSILVNTLLAGCAGTLSAGFLGYAIENRIDVTQFTNGALGGLVAITAACFAVSTPAAVLIGLVGGMIVVGGERWLIHYKIDDVVNAVPVHLGAGIWGTLAVGLYGDLDVLATGLSRYEQIAAQVLGIVACGVWTFSVAYIVFALINRIWRLRVPASHERYGFNLMQYGEVDDDEKVPTEELLHVGMNRYIVKIDPVRGASDVK